MAKSAVNQLKVAVRTETGKGASRRARRDGKIPAVLYGHGSDPQHLELPGHDFAVVLRHAGTNAVLTLDIDGKPHDFGYSELGAGQVQVEFGGGAGPGAAAGVGDEGEPDGH